MDNCCEVFPKLIREFKWMQYKENGKTYIVVPHLSKNNFRINFCPSCGKEVRSIALDKDELVSLNLL